MKRKMLSMKRSTAKISPYSKADQGCFLTILTLLVTEVLGDCESRQGNTSTGTRWLVHLSKHQGDLRFAIKLDDLCLLHFVVQIITLPSSLADTSENGVSTVCLGDVVDQLLNEHCLSDTCSSEKTDLPTTSVRGKQVDDFDTGDKNFSRCGLLDELRSVGVDRVQLDGLNRTPLIDGVTSNVHDSSEGSRSDRYSDGIASINGLCASSKTLSTVHCNRPNNILAQMLLLIVRLIPFEVQLLFN